MRFSVVSSLAFVLMQQHISSKVVPCLCEGSPIPRQAYQPSAWDAIINPTNTNTQQQIAQPNTDVAAIAASHDMPPLPVQFTAAAVNTQPQQNVASGSTGDTVSINQCLQAFPDLSRLSTTTQQQPAYTTQSYATPTYTYTTSTPVPTSTTQIQPTQTATPAPNCDANTQTWVKICAICDANPNDGNCQTYKSQLPTYCPEARKRCGMRRRQAGTLPAEMRPLCMQLVASTPPQTTNQPQQQQQQQLAQPQQAQLTVSQSPLGMDNTGPGNGTNTPCNPAAYKTQLIALAKLPQDQQTQQLQAMAAQSQAGRDSAYCLQYFLSIYSTTVLSS